jgi:hypothetical protein
MIEIHAPQPLLGLLPYYAIYDGERLFGAYVWAPTIADAYERARKVQTEKCSRFDFPAPVLDVVPADLVGRSAQVTEELLDALRRDAESHSKQLKSGGAFIANSTRG